MRNKKRKIIIDVDTGSDDALAILLAIKSKKFEILGITTVAGNTNLTQVTINTLKVLNLAGRLDISVFKGNSKPLKGESKRGTTQGKDGLCEVFLPSPKKKLAKLPAGKFIFSNLERFPKEVEIYATGPLTNIAELLNKYPKTGKQIKRIVIMGGAVERPGNITPFAEFNFYNDPEAVKIVFESGVPIILIPLDVTMEISLTRDWVSKKYGNSPNKITKFVVDLVNNRYKLIGKDWFYLHDPLAIGTGINKNFVSTKKEKLSIITKGKQKGQIIKNSRGSEIEWASRVRTKEFLNYFEKLLLK